MKYFTVAFLTFLTLLSLIAAKKLKCGPEGYPIEYDLFENNLKNFTPEQGDIARQRFDNAYGCDAKYTEYENFNSN